jgi:hypothetical protein
MLEERPVSQNTDPHSGQVWTYSVSKTRVILTFLPVTAPTRLRTLRLVCPLAVAVGCNPLNLREDSLVFGIGLRHTMFGTREGRDHVRSTLGQAKRQGWRSSFRGPPSPAPTITRSVPRDVYKSTEIARALASAKASV